MKQIAIISGSVRIGRNSHRVALHFKRYLEENKIAKAVLLDLAEYDFPIFHERLKNQVNPDSKTLDFQSKFIASDGILIITPEYNGGYPASVKNMVDLLTSEWTKKPVAIATVSDGSFGGTQVIVDLQYSLWKLHALTVPYTFPVPKAQEAFTEDGIPVDTETWMKRTKKFVDELMWMVNKMGEEKPQ
jgi:NAD(P)H-dependent FMN reductase